MARAVCAKRVRKGGFLVEALEDREIMLVKGEFELQGLEQAILEKAFRGEL